MIDCPNVEMRDRLPDRSRAPQAGGLKSGTAVGVMRSRWPQETLQTAERLDREGSWILQELGLVDAERFLQVVRGGVNWHSAVDVSITIYAEIWLRAHIAEVGHGGS